MNKLVFKILTEDYELQDYCNKYVEAFKNKLTKCYQLPLEQIKSRDKVVGVYKKGQLVAGYSLSNTPNILIKNMKPENKEIMQKSCPLDSCYDLSNIWRTDLSNVQFTYIVWPRIIFDTLFFNTERPNIIGYYLTGHRGAAIYNKTNPIYHQFSDTKHELNIFTFKKMNLVQAFFSAFISRSLIEIKKSFTFKAKKTHKANQ